jgi:protein-disulfide isomerase
MKKHTPKKFNVVGIVLGVLLIGALCLVAFMKMDRDQKVKAQTKLIPEIIQKLDPSVKVKEVAGLKVQSGIYMFDLKLDVQGKEQKFTSYMTKDGKYFFTGGIIVSDLDKKPAAAANEPPAKSVSCDEMKKVDAPKLTAFVVADCPYGLQMQRLMTVAAKENSELGKYFDVKYIGAVENGKITSMHGDKEAQENLRQICIREEQNSLYWPYVSCYMKEGKAEACLVEANVNQTQLNTCVSDAQKGLAYAQKDFDLANQNKVSGSPTLFMNDSVVSEFDYGGRNVDSLKQLVCCGSKNKPGFCGTQMSKDDVAASYSVQTQGQAGSAAANCAPAN